MCDSICKTLYDVNSNKIVYSHSENYLSLYVGYMYLSKVLNQNRFSW